MNQGAADLVTIFDQESMAKEKRLLPLEPFIQRAKFDVKPFGPALDQLRYEGKLYGVPLLISPQVVVYNQDLFRSAGATVPKNQWTWEDFRAAAKQDFTATSAGSAFDPTQDPFNRGKAAMARVAGGKRQIYVFPQTIGSAANSEQPQAAWEFLMYATGPQGAQIMARQGQLPMYQSADVQRAWFEQQPAPSAGSEFLFAVRDYSQAVADGRKLFQ